MDCDKVQDRFSSLWEKELVFSEEKIIREHLSSCMRCQKEFERFGKTMEWLRSVGDVDVPEGFLPELYKRIEKRKTALPAKKSEERWFIFPPSFKLPAQAVAMAGIVFLVLFLTKMVPMEVSHQRDAEETSFSQSKEKKSEQLLAQKKTKNERGDFEIPAEAIRQKDMEHPDTPPLGRKEIEDTRIAQTKEETPVLKERIPTPGPDQFKGGVVSKEKHDFPSQPTLEITLRITDLEKTISQLQELVKYFQGEMVAEGKDRFTVSLPTVSIPEFEKKLEEMSVSIKTNKEMAKNRISRGSGVVPDLKQEEGSERIEGSAKVASDQESRTVVLILLTQE